MKEITLYARTEADLDHVSGQILNSFPEDRIFALAGDLGAGKTALIKAFCLKLDVEQAVLSPTFALVNEYMDGRGDPIYHFDFYRIKKLEEVLDIGYEEYLYSGYYCFIEWGDMIRELLPADHVYIDIVQEEGSQTRILTVNKNST